MKDFIDIDSLIADREKFNSLVYTPINEAIGELKERAKNTELEKKINSLLEGDIPLPLQEAPRNILFRQLLTPNYEVRRFLQVMDVFEDFKPLFWEYYNDKFTSNNDFKRSLGKIKFHHGRGKKGGIRTSNINVIDFNESNGEKIGEVRTIWGEPLVKFHHDFFHHTYMPLGDSFFYDASNWFISHGPRAQDYYRNFIALFVKHSILFENFILNHESELAFTKEVFLPAFLEIYKITGYKPLIIALEPTDIEGDEFWYCHPSSSEKFVKEKYSL